MSDTDFKRMTSAQIDAAILADRLESEETFKEFADFAWANASRIVKALRSAAEPEELPITGGDVEIPLPALDGWIEVLERYTTSDHDGESYNNHDAIQAVEEMRHIRQNAVKRHKPQNGEGTK